MAGWLRLRGRVALTLLLKVGVADEQRFHLPQKIGGAERLDEQRVGTFSNLTFVAILLFITLPAPIFSRGWIGSEQCGRGIIGLAPGGAQDLESGFFGFHSQVADDHLVNAGLQAGEGFGRTRGRVHFKSMEFKHGFERQQDGEIVVDKKNAAFHMVVWGGRSCPPFLSRTLTNKI